MASPETVLKQAAAVGMTSDEIAVLEALLAQGLDGASLQVVMFAIRSFGVNDPRTQSAIQRMRVRTDVALREEAAGGPENLAAIEAALGLDVFKLSDADLMSAAPTLSVLREQHGEEPGFVNVVREFSGREPFPTDVEGNVISQPETPLDQSEFAAATGNTGFVPPAGEGVADDPVAPPGFGADRTLMGETNAGERVFLGRDGTVWVGGSVATGTRADFALTEAAANKASAGGGGRDIVGTVMFGKAEQLVQEDGDGNFYINGRLADMTNASDRSVVIAAEKAGPPSGGGGGGGAAVRLQNMGVDKDGFALIFNPATGSVTKGPQVSFGQIDPRITAAEEARRFNEQQALDEGEFLRDVLSNGRNFLTAALLTRGGRSGFTTGLTQADILSAGGVDAFGGGQQSLGGLNQSLGSLSPEDQEKVPGFVIEGLEEQGVLDPGTAVGFGPAGDGTPAPGLTSRFAIGDKPRSGTAASTNLAEAGSLGAQALAFAPPAVKDIAAGKEVGSLSTPGGGFAIPLSNPQTLANLSKDERGALDTTLQNVDQRTLGEFEQESIQRFRGQGSRTATRSR